MIYKRKDEERLMGEIWDPAIAENPLEFVKFVYPWGQANTPLERFSGPRGWQREVLEEVSAHIRHQKQAQTLELPMELFREAVSSGRGPGKSSLFGMLSHWMMSCNLGSTTIVTANTEMQLKSRTMAEASKWFTLGINSHWFDTSALSIRPAPWFANAIKQDLKVDLGYYYVSAQLWSEENPDAFAGAHNPHGILVVFDEASGIPKPIWTVTEGFFTEPVVHRYWLVFSNPRRPSGPFFECFHRNRNIWTRRRKIDSRTVEGTDTRVYEQIIEQYGDDSDEARVEVKGEFPHQGDKQFIGRDLVEAAREREVEPDPGAPLVMGVDVARFGGDKSVLRFRQGRDARTIPAQKFGKMNNMQLAYRVAAAIDKYKPDAVNIDAGGGAGVIDRLRELGYRINEIDFGSSADEPKKWANKRTEMWARLREWLPGGAIDDDDTLFDDLIGPEYDYRGADGGVVQLEPKEKMKERGLASTDDGDALALTFARRVSRRDMRTSRRGREGGMARHVDYDIFGA